MKTLCAEWNAPDRKGPLFGTQRGHVRGGSKENGGRRGELRSRCFMGTVSIWEDEEVLEAVLMVAMAAQCWECTE